MTVKYGSRALELSKGKRALSIGDIGAVPETIKLVIAAVQNGELDLAMEQAVSAGKSKSARSYPALGLRRTALAATSSRLSSSTVDMPGLSGNLAIEATVLFCSGPSDRRASVRA